MEKINRVKKHYIEIHLGLVHITTRTLCRITLHSYVNLWTQWVCAPCTNMMCCNVRIESISILTFQAMRSANQISITTYFDRRETYWNCLLFPLLEASIKENLQGYKSNRKCMEGISKPEKKNRNNIQLMNKYRTHLHSSSSFLLPSSSSVKESKQNFSLHFPLIEFIMMKM